MTRACFLALGALAIPLSACAPLTDEVFTTLALSPTSPLVVAEGAGVVSVTVRLAQPADRRLQLAYAVVGLEAQQDCQAPDFEAANGRVEWEAGAIEAQVPVWIADDELAERDERFELRFEMPDGAAEISLGSLEVVIADDDRSALLDAKMLGIVPNLAGDQSQALQAALAEAEALGQAVVVMAPGDYEISSVELPPGITLSAYDVRWHRPPLSATDVVTLRLAQVGSASSRPNLVEGLTIDGRRDEQGPYSAYERQDAHLLGLRGDAVEGGQLRATLQHVRLLSGTGSGVFIGPNAETTICHLSASDLWRDALTLNGGATRLRVRDLNATATQGTGLWLAAHEPGFADSYQMDVEVEDVQVGAGDVEIEVTDGSQVMVRRLTMTQSSFRLDAPGGSARIEDSVLVVGIPSARHNHWGQVHDVEVRGTTIIASESEGTGATAEQAREFAAVSVTSDSFAFGSASSGPGRLVFKDCRFQAAPDVEANDQIYGIQNPDVDAAISVESSSLGDGFTGWFAPDCAGCVMTK